MDLYNQLEEHLSHVNFVNKIEIKIFFQPAVIQQTVCIRENTHL